MYKINLLPQELLAEAAGKKRDVLLPGIIIFFGVLLAVYIGLAANIYIGQRQINEKKAAYKDLVPQIKRVEELQSQTARDKAQLAVLEKTDTERRHYYSVLAQVNSVLPVDMWLTRFLVSRSGPSEKEPDKLQAEDLQKPTRLVIEGVTGSLSSVGVYLNKLQELSYFEKVTLKEVKEVEVAPKQAEEPAVPAEEQQGEQPEGQQAEQEKVRIKVFTIEAVLKEGGWR